MEPRHVQHILQNLEELMKLTDCNIIVLVHLQSNRVISEEEYQKLQLPTLTQIEKAEKLYKIAITKKNSYKILFEALNKTLQTGAAEILHRELHVTFDPTEAHLENEIIHERSAEMVGKKYKIYLFKDAETQFWSGWYPWWLEQTDGHRYYNNMTLFQPKCVHLHKYDSKIYPEKHFLLIYNAVKQETSHNSLIRMCWVNDKKNEKVRATLELELDKRFLEALNVESMGELRILINGSFRIGYGWSTVEYGNIEYKLNITDIVLQENAVIEGFEGASVIEKAIRNNMDKDLWIKLKYDVLLTWSDLSVYTQKFHIGEQLLKKQPLTDCVIIAENDVRLPTHRNILCLHSNVLNAMLTSLLPPGQQHVIDMTDISERGVRAFLRYLYLFDFSAAEETDTIAMELLKLSNKFKIQGLEKTLLQLLSFKSSNWFKLETVLELYIFSQNISKYSGLTTQMLKEMKSKRSQLRACSLYHTYREKHPALIADLAMNIMEL